MSYPKPGESHQLKMIRKRAGRRQRIGYAERNAGIKQDVEKFCLYWQAVRRKNGLGSKLARAKYLADPYAGQTIMCEGFNADGAP